MLVGAYNYLDLAPKGRNEDGLSYTMEWLRHHDQYDVGTLAQIAKSSDAALGSAMVQP